MVRQETYGYLLTHYAFNALICKARRRSRHRPRPGQTQAHRQDRPLTRRPFPLTTGGRILASVMADVTRKSTSTRSAGTGRTPVLSSRAATIPTG
jgi:hypothetical protein